MQCCNQAESSQFYKSQVWDSSGSSPKSGPSQQCIESQVESRVKSWKSTGVKSWIHCRRSDITSSGVSGQPHIFLALSNPPSDNMALGTSQFFYSASLRAAASHTCTAGHARLGSPDVTYSDFYSSYWVQVSRVRVQSQVKSTWGLILVLNLDGLFLSSSSWVKS